MTTHDALHITWPSGEGAEFGVVAMPLSAIAALTGQPIVEDDGASAVVLDQGPDMPVTFFREPEPLDDAVAIVADLEVDVPRLRRRVERIFGDACVTWNDLARERV